VAITRRAARVFLIVAVAGALLTPTGCAGVQTQKGEPEPSGSSVTSRAPGSEEAQPGAGEEQSGTEQPGTESTVTTP
jgi:hypothetical protein